MLSEDLADVSDNRMGSVNQSSWRRSRRSIEGQKAVEHRQLSTRSLSVLTYEPTSTRLV